jgi:hypothetical protein
MRRPPCLAWRGWPKITHAAQITAPEIASGSHVGPWADPFVTHPSAVCRRSCHSVCALDSLEVGGGISGPNIASPRVTIVL